jgi:hypothetical protein
MLNGKSSNDVSKSPATPAPLDEVDESQKKKKHIFFYASRRVPHVSTRAEHILLAPVLSSIKTSPITNVLTLVMTHLSGHLFAKVFLNESPLPNRQQIPENCPSFGLGASQFCFSRSQTQFQRTVVALYMRVGARKMEVPNARVSVFKQEHVLRQD